jgi:hypothetical protein
MKKTELIKLLNETSNEDIEVFMRDETHYRWEITNVILDERGIAIYFDYDDPIQPV